MKKWLLIFFNIAIMLFLNFNFFMYSDPILKVSDIKTETIDEEYFCQTITGVIKNGEYKGKIFTFENQISTSGVYENKVNEFSEIFVNISSDGTNISSIKEIKRDKYVGILILIFIDLLFIIAKKNGAKTLLSLAVNILLSVLGVYIYISSSYTINILFIFIPISLAFIVSSLYITCGKTKKTLSAILSTIVSVFLVFVLSLIILNLYDGALYLYTTDYAEIISDYKSVFYLSILLSGLGAIMDIAITVSSLIDELITKNKDISYKDLENSGKNISKDITGTMVNVLLFTCLSSTLPTLILALKNNLDFVYAINYYGQVQIIIILTSCIGVILAVPISLKVALYVLKGVRK